MPNRLAPEAETDLDDIWYYTAKESGSFEIADRLIDSIVERIFLLATHPHIGRHRSEDLRQGPPTCLSCVYCEAAGTF